MHDVPPCWRYTGDRSRTTDLNDRGDLQMFRGSCLRFFQLLRLPEAALRRNDWAALAGLLTGASRKGAFTGDDLAEYRAAWSQPGAITAMLNWYRAILRQDLRGVERRIQTPVELIWGAHDPAAGIELARRSIARCDQGQLDLIEGATHWIQHERPDQVQRLIERFFR
jgi:epoxide hydrolase 4